jgi:PEP-CTERM motif
MARIELALFAAAATAVVALGTGSAQAAVASYTGFDSGWSSAPPVGPNSLKTEQSFVTATGATNPITFAGGKYPSGVTITSSASASGVVDTGTGPCGFALCGGDTDGNGWFLFVDGGQTTITFSKPIDYFGAYFSGLQTTDTITWTDSSGSQSVTIPTGSSGGMAFAGFTDLGQKIGSVTVDATNDIIGVDDILYTAASSAIPEPAAWAMILLGFGLVGSAVRSIHRRAVA